MTLNVAGEKVVGERAIAAHLGQRVLRVGDQHTGDRRTLPACLPAFRATKRHAGAAEIVPSVSVTLRPSAQREIERQRDSAAIYGMSTR